MSLTCHKQHGFLHFNITIYHLFYTKKIHKIGGCFKGHKEAITSIFHVKAFILVNIEWACNAHISILSWFCKRWIGLSSFKWETH